MMIVANEDHQETRSNQGCTDHGWIHQRKEGAIVW